MPNFLDFVPLSKKRTTKNLTTPAQDARGLEAADQTRTRRNSALTTRGAVGTEKLHLLHAGGREVDVHGEDADILAVHVSRSRSEGGLERSYDDARAVTGSCAPAWRRFPADSVPALVDSRLHTARRWMAGWLPGCGEGRRRVDLCISAASALHCSASLDRCERFRGT
jgi:hypothetical protein